MHDLYMCVKKDLKNGVIYGCTYYTQIGPDIVVTSHRAIADKGIVCRHTEYCFVCFTKGFPFDFHSHFISKFMAAQPIEIGSNRIESSGFLLLLLVLLICIPFLNS